MIQGTLKTKGRPAMKPAASLLGRLIRIARPQTLRIRSEKVPSRSRNSAETSAVQARSFACRASRLRRYSVTMTDDLSTAGTMLHQDSLALPVGVVPRVLSPGARRPSGHRLTDAAGRIGSVQRAQGR